MTCMQCNPRLPTHCTQVLSMSRLGGAAAVAPLVADMSSEVTLSLTLPFSLPLAVESSPVEWRAASLSSFLLLLPSFASLSL